MASMAQLVLQDSVDTPGAAGCGRALGLCNLHAWQRGLRLELEIHLRNNITAHRGSQNVHGLFDRAAAGYVELPKRVRKTILISPPSFCAIQAIVSQRLQHDHI